MFDAIAKVVGGVMDSLGARSRQQSAENIAQQNMNMQRDFAQMGVRWRVDDAKAAGIHPLAALGAQTQSFSPVQLGDTGSTNWSSALSGLGLDKMGQNTDRAERATQTVAQRDAAVASKLELQGKSLDNEFKRLGLASAAQRMSANNNPPMPDSMEPFKVPENKKSEERPPLMMFGKRWMTNPNTSPMKAWEDQYGDEGPVAWTMPLVIGANDAVYNAGRASNWLWNRKRSPLFGAEEPWYTTKRWWR